MMMDRREALKKSGLLAGIGLSAAALGTFMQSCASEDRLLWSPRFLSESEARSVSAMVDHILPATDTAGGLDLQVDMFVDLMMSESLSDADQSHVQSGLRSFLKSCRDKNNEEFHELAKEKQASILKELGANTNTFNVAVWGSPIGDQAPIDFYRRIRQFALLGYFSSEKVGKEVLAYDPIPGEYEACVDLQPGQKLWTL